MALEKPALRVLVVDDNPDAADSLAMMLRFWGYDYRVSYDGPSALQTAREYHPHCLLLDINMPTMDGCMVAQRLRQESNLRDVKLVAVTAYSDEANTRRIREAGFNYHLIKPTNPEELAKILMAMNSLLSG
jgi:CheY-like chemotaxis protein